MNLLESFIYTCILATIRLNVFLDFESALSDFQWIRVFRLADILMCRLVVKPALSKQTPIYWFTRMCTVVACISERFQERPRLLTAVVVGPGSFSRGL